MIVTKNKQPTPIESTKQYDAKYVIRKRLMPCSAEIIDVANAIPIPIAPVIAAIGIALT